MDIIHSMPENKRIDQLSFPRFIAALLIIIFHYGRSTYPFALESLAWVAASAQYLLSFFYTLSGFILAYVYYKPDGAPIDQRVFWVRRLARIYPLYLLAFLLAVPFRFGASPNDLTGLVLGVFMLQAWVPPYPLAFSGPAWAMSAMWLFYLIFPWLMPWMVKKGAKSSLIFSAGVWLASQILFLTMINCWAGEAGSWSRDVTLYNPLLHLNSFIFGMAAGLFYRTRREQARINQPINLLGLIGSLAAIGALFYARPTISALTGFQINYYDGLLTPLYLLAIVFLAQDETLISKAISHKWLVFLGEISFSIYLLQSPVVRFYQQFLLPRLEAHIPWTKEIHFYLYLGLLLPVSIGLYFLFEKPLNRWLRGKLAPGEKKG